MTVAASRREFLRRASAFAAAGIASPYAMGFAGIAAASAQTASDYKALVYVNLSGGNDHFSTFVPYDPESYARYAKVRKKLALDRASLLPLGPTGSPNGREIAFTAQMAGMLKLYNAGRLAVVPSVGSLLQPTTRSEIDTGRAKLPKQLASHLDQSNQWANLNDASPFGWGGRMADILASNNANPSMTTISTAGSAFFGIGARTVPFAVASYGVPEVFFPAGSPLDRAVTGSARRTNLLEKAYSQAYEGLRDGSNILSGAIMPDESVRPAPGRGENELANGLRTIGRLIGASAKIGARRQVFYVEMYGFDTHEHQADLHPQLMKKLNDALVYFDALLGQIGMRNNVTLFTASEFGRSFIPNGDGTDHGWGSHQIVMGGAVNGGKIHGRLPVIGVDNPDTAWARGPLLPRIAASQYAATLGRWMGIGDGDLSDILPSLSRFGSSDLGFMK